MVPLDRNIYKCYIIGDGSERPKLEKLTKDLNVSNNIIFTGKKRNIGDYLQILDVFVLPSNESESFGNSAVEAIGLGIPTIVMRDGGGLTEHIVEGGGFIAESKLDLTNIILELSSSKVLRSQVGEKGKKYVREKYSITNMVKCYDNLYQINNT